MRAISYGEPSLVPRPLPSQPGTQAPPTPTWYPLLARARDLSRNLGKSWTMVLYPCANDVMFSYESVKRFRVMHNYEFNKVKAVAVVMLSPSR